MLFHTSMTCSFSSYGNSLQTVPINTSMFCLEDELFFKKQPCFASSATRLFQQKTILIADVCSYFPLSSTTSLSFPGSYMVPLETQGTVRGGGEGAQTVILKSYRCFQM